MLLLRVVTENVPPVSNLRRASLPQLREDDGPDAHEDGEGDGSGVIEEIFRLCHGASLLKLPGVTELEYRSQVRENLVVS